MKNLRFLIGVLALTLIATTNIFAVVVSAPLDGGLLAILGAAGIAYFVVRRKKKASN